jgi:hypothetical protein
MRLNELFLYTGTPFPYYPSFAHRFDISVNACVLLCYVGWKTMPDRPDDWIKFNAEDLTKATGLSAKEQATARRQLIAAGLLEGYYARLDHVLKLRVSGKEIDNEQGEGAFAERANGHTPETEMPTGVHLPKEQMAISPNGVSSLVQVKSKERTNKEEIELQAEALWKAYPRKAGKKPGLKAIIKSLKSNKFEDLLKATHKFCAMWEGEPDKTFCPHAATWFNQERFNEDPTEWTRPHQGNGNGSRSFPVPRNDYEREVPPDERY